MDALQQIMIGIGSLLLFTIVFINFYLKGFLFKYASVRISNGRKILLQIHTKTGYYYVAAKLSNATLQYKDREKKQRSYTNIPQDAVSNVLGIRTMTIDEDAGSIYLPGQNKDVNGNDAERFDDMLLTAYMKPARGDKMMTILLILVIAAIIASIIAAYFGYKNYSLTLQVLSKISTPIVTGVVTPGA
jgi:hypothetical protein